MAKNQRTLAKRQREMEKKRKADEKRERRRNKGRAASPEQPETQATNGGDAPVR